MGSHEQRAFIENWLGVRGLIFGKRGGFITACSCAAQLRDVVWRRPLRPVAGEGGVGEVRVLHTFTYTTRQQSLVHYYPSCHHGYPSRIGCNWQSRRWRLAVLLPVR